MTVGAVPAAAVDWRPAPAGVALGAGEIDVWRVPLIRPAGEIAALARTLSADERDRAARFHFERDRAAFTVARGALRALLGRYLARPPGDIAFGYHARGKPYLAGSRGDPGTALPEMGSAEGSGPRGAAPPDVTFNVSHSGELALIAVTRGREVGVDVERKRALDDLLSLARISFAPGEYAALCALPPADHAEAFFACWSRKEAFIKATGEGVAQLADFDVTLHPGEPPRLLRVDGDAARRRWSLHALPDSPGYASALAVEDVGDARAHLGAIRCWDWPGAPAQDAEAASRR